MLNVARHWYRSSYTWLTFLLLPLSWFFRALVRVRRFLYQSGLKKIHRFPVPVIVVGNITVGGTGKTPFVIGLVDFLKEQGYQPGIVSRGVGGSMQRLPRCVNKDADPHEVGDEAVLLAKRTNVPVVVGIDRVAAVKTLLARTACNIVVSDDGLQHYRLGRDIEIAMLDGSRRLGNQQFLPAGPLRESPTRLKTVDFIVTQGIPEADEVAMVLKGEHLVSLKNPLSVIPLTNFKAKRVHAIAGIGNPTRFFALLRTYGLEVEEHIFPDHYLYRAEDIVFNDHFPVLMTEKDSVKCVDFRGDNHWFLPVNMQLDSVFQEKLLKILSIVD